MRNRLRVINGGGQPERLDNAIRGFKTVIVLVAPGETKKQAWRRHLRKHPEDKNADIKIFHFALNEKP